ncbi:hypothetical protein C8F01DRAFT_1144733 [Mycena amicta]|nr:hypothetical protein C8F01DRAFT_1144733 [Mycena amicta]
MRILLLLTLVSYVAAYAAPGAYERLWFYYAYLVDVSNGGVATKIATGCVVAMETGGKPCTFNQFVQYINADPAAKDFAVTSDAMPNVETTVQTLQDKGLTGAYNPSKIRGDVGRNGGVAALFKSISGFLDPSGPVSSADPAIKTALRDATTGVARTRLAASVEDLGKVLGTQGIVMETRPVPLFDGATEMVDWIDGRTTATNAGITMDSLKATVKAWKDKELSHWNNIMEAKAAAAKMSAACLPPA